jgi:AraC-like DNA-binding protein
MLFEAWDDALRSACGHYYAVPHDRQNSFHGHFLAQRLCGLDMANFAGNLRRIDRTRQGIRLDDHEHLYLLVQLSGSTRIEQRDCSSILLPGTLYLLDSTRPSQLVFDHAWTHCLSLHLPRASSLAEPTALLRVGEVLDETAPAARRLRSYILNATNDRKTTPQAKPEYLLDLTRLAFGADGSENVARGTLSQGSRFELAVLEIEIFATQPELSLAWLADRIGISARQLERDFQAHDTSFVQVMREQRLKLACNLIELAKRGGREARITDIAFASGFRDLSNFNRAFRTRFGLTPRDYARTSDFRLPRQLSQSPSGDFGSDCRVF